MSHRTLLSALLALVTLFPILTQAQVEKLTEADLQKYQSQLPDAINAAKGAPLRSHLERVQRQRISPESRRAGANAVRVAQDVKGFPFSGQVVHYAVDPMSELQRLPDAYPLDGRAMRPVTIIAAQDEFEPGSFVLYPLANLGKVKLELGEFRSVDGKVFPKGDLDLKVIKVWYQNGNGWYSYFGDTGLKLTPELLLNDEELIRSDTKQVQNYARLTGKDGKVSYHWITPPLEIEFGSNGASELFSPMKEDFRDAPTLQPVTLNEGEFRQFFLTAHVTEKHAPGLYRGEIRLLRAAESLGTVPIVIRVLPFKLPSPKTYFDLNKDLLVANMSYIGLDLISLQNGGDLKLAEGQLRSIVKDMKDHNQTIHPLRESSGIPMLKELGMMTDPYLGNTHLRTGNRFEMANHARAMKKWALETLGHTNVITSYGDEPSAGWVMAMRPLYEAYQKEGFKTSMAGNVNNLMFKGGYLYDLVTLATDPHDREATRKWNEVGRAWVAWYACQHVGAESPALNRRVYGIAPYLANYSAIYNYAHHLGPYNDRSTTYKPMVFAYGIYDGVLDTLAWEGFREGIDDIRYATLLKSLAKQATASERNQLQYAGYQALQFFAQLDNAACDLDATRLEMIRHITKLQGLLGK